MATILVLVLAIAIQGVLCKGTPCSGDIKAKTRDGDTCYECGKSKLPSPTEQWSTVGKQVASPGDFPWNVAIYKLESTEWEQTCGGTLISPQAVLTAANCVTTFKYQPFNASDVRVVLGSTHRSWNSTADPSAIKKQVKEVLVNPYYRGMSINFASDIALLILDSEVPTSSDVMPACLDFNTKQPSLYEKDAIGYISGFGYTQECGVLCSDRPETLMYTSTKVLEFQQCFLETQRLNPTILSRITPDKFCIGNSTVSPIQRGDGGSGFTLISQGLHYVTGIASVKLTGSTSPRYSFGALTNVTHHMDWLKKNLPE